MVERSRREISRNQEQETHKVGLVDGYKNDQHGERQLVDRGRLHVIEGPRPSVNDCQVMQHHQRDKKGPQVVGEIEAIGQFSRRRQGLLVLPQRLPSRRQQVLVLTPSLNPLLAGALRTQRTRFKEV